MDLGLLFLGQSLYTGMELW